MLKINYRVFKFFIISQLLIIAHGLSIQNYYTKSGCYNLENTTNGIDLLKDFENIKRDIEQLKQQQTVEVQIQDQPIFDIRFDILPEKCQSQDIPSNCDEATTCTKRSGYYHIEIKKFSTTPFLVECDAHYEGGGWTVIQRRQDGSEDFYRTWHEYQQGFGDMTNEFFIGLDKLYALTHFNGPQELLILMENGTNHAEGYAKYDAFEIGNAEVKFILKHYGRYTGNAGDSLQNHMRSKFTTKDRDNDLNPNANCAVVFTGAWWYNNCHSSNLNGRYGDNQYGKGINWFTFSTHENSLKFVKMMIRRRRN